MKLTCFIQFIIERYIINIKLNSLYGALSCMLSENGLSDVRKILVDCIKTF